MQKQNPTNFHLVPTGKYVLFPNSNDIAAAPAAISDTSLLTVVVLLHCMLANTRCTQVLRSPDLFLGAHRNM
jgi:hypothetical protein